MFDMEIEVDPQSDKEKRVEIKFDHEDIKSLQQVKNTDKTELKGHVNNGYIPESSENTKL